MPYTFCPKCGAQVEWGPTCSQCGARIPLWHTPSGEKKPIELPEYHPYKQGIWRWRLKFAVLLLGLVVSLAVVALCIVGALWFSGVIFKSAPPSSVPSTSIASTSTSITSVSFASPASVYGEPVCGKPVTFTASVSPETGTGTPTGTLTFYDSTTELGNATLSSGRATYTTSSLSVGYRNITAVYSGDMNFAASASDALVQVVVALTSYPTKSAIVNGHHAAGAKGNLIALVENPNATNPTQDQLLCFLRYDYTDQQTYIPGTFVCTDFAQMLQNHAEEVGWRCAWVSLEFRGQSEGHAINAFNTTDKGLVFIDDTGDPAGKPHPTNLDRVVDVEVGKDYTPDFLFPEGDWTFETLGVVSEIDIVW